MSTIPAVMPGVPTITLAGQQWPVLPLTLGQLRTLQPVFNRVVGRVLSSNLSLHELTEQDLADLAQIALTGMSKAHPTMTEAELSNMPIGVLELVGALLPVMEQSGLFKRAESPGEAAGA